MTSTSDASDNCLDKCQDAACVGASSSIGARSKSTRGVIPRARATKIAEVWVTGVGVGAIEIAWIVNGRWLTRRKKYLKDGSA